MKLLSSHCWVAFQQWLRLLQSGNLLLGIFKFRKKKIHIFIVRKETAFLHGNILVVIASEVYLVNNMEKSGVSIVDVE